MVQIVAVAIVTRVVAASVHLFKRMNTRKRYVQSFTSRPQVRGQCTMYLVMASVYLATRHRHLSFALQGGTFVYAQVRRILRKRIHGLRARFASRADLSPANERLSLIVYLKRGIMLSVRHSIV